MTGYVRKDTSNNIADGNIINAADLDAEFDGVQDAFNVSTGHRHDGTAGEGAPITVVGPTQDIVVGAAIIRPKTTNTVDIGSTSLGFKDIFITGTATLPTVNATTVDTTNLEVTTLKAKDGTSAGSIANATGVVTLASSILTTADINGGTLDNVVIGGSTAAAASVTTLAASGAVTLSGGTANGVAYLNGSKVLTTGSALTFDGTNLGVGTSSPSYDLQVGSYGVDADSTLALASTTTGTGSIRFGDGTSGTDANAGLLRYDHSNNSMVFWTNTAEQMRLTSTGLGIGTSSPSYKLHVVGAAGFANNGNENLFLLDTATSNRSSLQISGTSNFFNANIDSASHGQYIWRSSNAYTERMRLDTSGNLGIGTSSPGAKIEVAGSGQAAQIWLRSTDTTSARIRAYISGAESGVIGFLNGGGQFFEVAGSEGMRLTSNGLGIGTTSPNTRLTIGGYGPANQTPDIQITRSSSGTAIQTGPNITFGDGTTNNSTTLQVTQGRFGVWNYGAGVWNERMSIDASGNLGLGVTPSAWTSGSRALQVGSRGALFDSSGGTVLSRNYYNDGQARYLTTAAASALSLEADGSYKFFTAPSGTAGNVISLTQAMTLDASGNLGVGTTSPASRLDVYSTGNTTLTLSGSSGGGGDVSQIDFFRIGSNVTSSIKAIRDGSNISGALTFLTANSGTNTERARIDASGNLGVGTTSPAATLHIRGGGGSINSVLDSSTSADTRMEFRNNGTRAGYLYWDANETRLFADSSRFMSFYTGGSERARISAAGNLGLGVVTAPAFLIDATAPSAGDTTIRLTKAGSVNTTINAVTGALTFGIDGSGGATERMRIASTGNIGVGTASPSFRLDAVNNAAGLARFSFSNPNAGMTQTDLRIGAGSNTNDLFIGITNGNTTLDNRSTNGVLQYLQSGTERMRFDSAGNMLLGTTSSYGKFTVVGSDIATNAVISGASRGVRVGANSVFAYLEGVDHTGTASYQPLMIGGSDVRFSTSGTGTERMRIDASGNLGINTTSPALTLDVNGSAYIGGSTVGSAATIVRRAYTPNAANITFGTLGFASTTDGTTIASAAQIIASSAEAWTGTATGSNLIFRTNSIGVLGATERARIDSSGNLLVRKTATGVGTVGFAANDYIEVTRDGNPVAYFTRLNTDGDAVQFRRSSGASVGSISVTATATAYNTSSDYRLKHDIAPMTGALAKVAALKPCTYKWNADDSAGEGFIAHELAEVVPQAVTGAKDAVDEEGNPVYQGIDTSFLVATLTAAIQEQQAIINQLKARVEALEASSN